MELSDAYTEFIIDLYQGHISPDPRNGKPTLMSVYCEDGETRVVDSFATIVMEAQDAGVTSGLAIALWSAANALSNSMHNMLHYLNGVVNLDVLRPSYRGKSDRMPVVIAALNNIGSGKTILPMGSLTDHPDPLHAKPAFTKLVFDDMADGFFGKFDKVQFVVKERHGAVDGLARALAALDAEAVEPGKKKDWRGDRLGFLDGLGKKVTNRHGRPKSKRKGGPI